MKSNNYNKLKKKINRLNELNDKIEFIEWNKDDGPKFSSIKEMKEFINKVNNNEFDFIFSEDGKQELENNSKKLIIEDFKYNVDDVLFYIYTYCRDGKYLTYLSLKKQDEENYISNLCGRYDNCIESAHKSFNELKESILNNELNDIINKLIVGADQTIKDLQRKFINIVSEN